MQIRKGDPGYDKLLVGKLVNWERLNTKIYNMSASSKTTSIYEQMVGTKARCSLIQYMPKSKQHLEYKFGL